jgi:hypothetical protein
LVGVGWKSLPGTNTLAYYENEYIRDRKRFIALSPGWIFPNFLQQEEKNVIPSSIKKSYNLS